MTRMPDSGRATYRMLRSKPPHNNINVQPTVIGKDKLYTEIASHI